MLTPTPSRFARCALPRAFALFLLPAVLITVQGCRRGRPSAPPPPPPPTQMPPPVPLYYDNGGGIRDSVRTIVRTADSLSSYWRQATSTQASPPPMAAIDFSREMVIVVATGRRTPEEQIHVDSLLVRPELMPTGRREEQLTIVVRLVVGCGRMRTAAYPVEIVRARRFDGPVTWRHNTERSNCDSPAPGGTTTR